MNSNRCFTLNNSSRKSKFRPSSAKRQLNLFKKYAPKDTPPPIMCTLPNYPSNKKSGMGNKIEREQLYEDNMQLKDIINNLRRELAEVKNKLVKKDIEIRKKEKLIKECSKENDLESTHELNIQKAKESTLISLFKQNYNELKKEYNKIQEENNTLHSEYTVTKVKEYTIQIDILKKEMEKMRNLYLQTVENNNKLNKEIQNLKELKKYFIEQHCIIDKLERTIKENKEEIDNLKRENEEYKEKLEQNLKKQKILQVKKDQMIKELKKKRPKSMRETYMPGSIIDRKDLKKIKTQKICLDNEGAYLISPSNNNIKMGYENDFKIKVPNSVGVCVLDGRNWNYLKRKKNDKNMWFGKVNIDNPNVTILSMKENSLFTEVFQLKARNVNGNLLKTSRTSRDKDKKIKFSFN